MNESLPASRNRILQTNKWLESNLPDHTSQREIEGLAGELYASCLTALRLIYMEQRGRRPSGSQSLLLGEELGRLHLWGQGFHPGELDEALEHSEDVRSIVLRSFKGIGVALLRGIPLM